MIAMVAPWLYLIVYFGAPLLNSQRRHLLAVERHIAAIAPQWNKFRMEHPGFENVQLFAYTGGDGMFGAHGSVPGEGHIIKLRQFMESARPPRPIFLEPIYLAPPDINRVKRAADAPATNTCRILERVYHDGWRTCGEILISKDGHYSWTVSDVWSTPPKSQTFTGVLPQALLRTVLETADSFDVEDAVRSYELGVDDHRTRHPEGVNALREYLRQAHLDREQAASGDAALKDAIQP